MNDVNTEMEKLAAEQAAPVVVPQITEEQFNALLKEATEEGALEVEYRQPEDSEDRIEV